MTSKDSEIRKEQGIRVFVDAHVHIHDCFGLQEFFDAAARNFAFLSSNAASTTFHRYVLCLTETNRANKFEELSRQADDNSEDMRTDESIWSFKHGGSHTCLIAGHPVLGQIEIVAGRQIVTKEKLEILALGLVETLEDGLAASDVVKLVIKSGAIPVLPWGFGKWLGRRRRAVRNLIDEFGDGRLYLGDNSGRPAFMADLAEFALARRLGMRVLPGTDPLPFTSECDKAGSFGFYVDGVADSEDVWTGLRSMLQQGNGDLHYYGSLESPLRFLRNQVAMQYVTRVANRREAI